MVSSTFFEINLSCNISHCFNVCTASKYVEVPLKPVLNLLFIAKWLYIGAKATLARDEQLSGYLLISWVTWWHHCILSCAAMNCLTSAAQVKTQKLKKFGSPGVNNPTLIGTYCGFLDICFLSSLSSMPRCLVGLVPSAAWTRAELVHT